MCNTRFSMMFFNDAFALLCADAVADAPEAARLLLTKIPVADSGSRFSDGGSRDFPVLPETDQPPCFARQRLRRIKRSPRTS